MRVNFNAPVQNNTTKKTVHNIVILDSSGSMNGEKWQSAVKFVNDEMDVYKTQDKE